LSGPLLDRFDVRVDVRPPDPEVLLAGSSEESSADVAQRVAAARRRARARGVAANAFLSPARLEEVAPLAEAAESVLRLELQRGRLTGRGLRRIRAVALTVADLRAVAEEQAVGVAEGGRGPMTPQRETVLTADDVQAALTLRSTPTSVLGVAS
jgi:magnesium chelatase family protein